MRLVVMSVLAYTVRCVSILMQVSWRILLVGSSNGAGTGHLGQAVSWRVSKCRRIMSRLEAYDIGLSTISCVQGRGHLGFTAAMCQRQDTDAGWTRLLDETSVVSTRDIHD
ncbi:hypothetical protein V8F06_010389 [Rhypophila decipiens]